jgi:hypothetical protein
VKPVVAVSAEPLIVNLKSVMTWETSWMLAVLFVRVMVNSEPVWVISAVAEIGPLPPGGVPENVKVAAFAAVAPAIIRRQSTTNAVLSLVKFENIECSLFFTARSSFRKGKEVQVKFGRLGCKS